MFRPFGGAKIAPRSPWEIGPKGTQNEPQEAPGPKMSPKRPKKAPKKPPPKGVQNELQEAQKGIKKLSKRSPHKDPKRGPQRPRSRSLVASQPRSLVASWPRCSGGPAAGGRSPLNPATEPFRLNGGRGAERKGEPRKNCQEQLSSPASNFS